jgi:hypothetical protein
MMALAIASGLNSFAADSALDPKSAWDGNGPEPAYVSEKWPDAPVLTWANPGTSGELSNPDNWLENGKPAKKAPDETTDIILPVAASSYTVNAVKQKVRHVDIGKNAELMGKHRSETEIWGNCWIHDGGYALFVSFNGDRHAFVKNEQTEFPSQENGLKYRGPKSKGGKQNASQLSHKLQICKFGTASIEFIGNFGASDEIMLQHGRLILNGELRWSGYTGKGALEIYDGGILELQSGAKIVPFMPKNNKAIYNINLYRNSMLQAGSPERPLTADATVFLGFEQNTAPGLTGLYAAQGSMIRVYSSDPTKHRLVFSSTAATPDLHSAAAVPMKPLADEAKGSLGTTLQLAGDIVLDGVHFDYLCEGGIALAKSVDSKDWKNVTYGSHNAAKGKDLFSEMKVAEDVYYHARGDGASEYAMVTTAVKNMNSYLKESDPFLLKTLPESTTEKEAVISVSKRNSEKMLVPTSVVFKKSVDVTIECKASGARMRYTLDGTEPTKDSPEYKGPIKLTETTKLMVKAYKSGLGFSPTYTAVYIVD